MDMSDQSTHASRDDKYSSVQLLLNLMHQ